MGARRWLGDLSWRGRLLDGLVITALVLLVASAAAWRWERHREPVPGVSIPRWAHQLESGAPALPDACIWSFEVFGDPRSVMHRVHEHLRRQGWVQHRALGAARVQMRRESRRLSVSVRPHPGTRWSRLRLQLRPCRESRD